MAEEKSPVFRVPPQPRVLESRPYEPGRSAADLGPAGQRLARVVKLASNENPLGPSPRALQAIESVLAGLSRYPDPAGRKLRAAIAHRLGVPVESIVLSAGSDQLLAWLAQVFLDRGRAALVSTHTFPTYRMVALAAAAPVVVAPSRPEDDLQPFAHDPTALAVRVRGSGVGILFLDNPCNPVASVLSRDEIETLLADVPSDVLVVIDEAYVDFMDDPANDTVLPLLASHPNLVVTRTFSKIYGLAGVRLGFGIMHPEAAALLSRIRLPFAVSSVALAAGEAAWEDREHYEKSRRHVLIERPRLAEALARRGWRVLPSSTNFLTARPPLAVARLHEALLGRGIILRPLRGEAISNYLRISIGTREEDDLFLAHLDELAAGELRGVHG